MWTRKNQICSLQMSMNWILVLAFTVHAIAMQVITSRLVYAANAVNPGATGVGS